MEKCTLNAKEWMGVADSVEYVRKIIEDRKNAEKNAELKEAFALLEADLLAAMSACFYVSACAADKVVFANADAGEGSDHAETDDPDT